MIRLQEEKPGQSEPYQIHFNSSMIRLQEVPAEESLLSKLFQFLNDTITSLQKQGLSQIVFHFNSSMIRLQAPSAPPKSRKCLFQFLNDTITSMEDDRRGI